MRRLIRVVMTIALLPISVASAADDALLIIHREDGRLIRRLPASAPVQSAPVLLDDRLLFSDTSGATWCYPMDGTEPVWTHRGGAPILASPRVAEDVVLVSNLADVIVALDRTTGELKWRHAQQLDPKRASELQLYGAPQPLLMGSEVIVGFSDGTLAGLDLDSGGLLWQRRIGEGTYPDLIAPPVLAGDRLLLAAYSEPLVSVDPLTRNIQWRLEVGGAHPATVGHQAGRIFHGGVDGILRALATESGAEIWSWDSETGSSLTQPILTDGGLLVASSGGGIYLVSPETGDLIWSWEPGYRLSGFSAALTVEGRRAVAVSNAGYVMSFIVPR